jgi:hypothetical protein
VRLQVTLVFPNDPRDIHRMQRLETSSCVPTGTCTPPEPACKSFEMFGDVLPRRRDDPKR